MRLAGVTLLVLCSLAGVGCHARPEPAAPPIIQSTSPDDLPTRPTSGLGTPGGDEDAGLPLLKLDGGAPRR